MWTNDVAQQTSATPGEVWSVLADVARWGEWNDGVAAIEIDGAPGLGARVAMTLPDGEVLTSRIVTWQPERRLSDLTEVEGVAVWVDHDLDGGPDGTTVTYRIRVEASAPVPDEVAEQIGVGASADFPEVIAALIARAERRERTPGGVTGPRGRAPCRGEHRPPDRERGVPPVAGHPGLAAGGDRRPTAPRAHPRAVRASGQRLVAQHHR